MDEIITIKASITDSKDNQSFFLREMTLISSENFEPSENEIVNSDDDDFSTDEISS